MVSRSLSTWVVLVALLALRLAAMVLAGRGPSGTGDEGGVSADPERERTVGESLEQKSCGPDAETVSIIAEPSYDFTNESKIVGHADNVFVGRVSRELAGVPPSRNSPPLPSSRFAVEVKENIEGSLSGTVIVSQAGGCDPRYGHILLINEDPLLKPGDVAVFSTSKDPSGEHPMIAYQFSHVEAETPEQRAKVVTRFEEAR